MDKIRLHRSQNGVKLKQNVLRVIHKRLVANKESPTPWRIREAELAVCIQYLPERRNLNLEKMKNFYVGAPDCEEEYVIRLN